MKNRRISRQTFAIRTADDTSRPGEILRTLLAVTMAVGLIATGAIALPSLSPGEAGAEIQPVTVAPGRSGRRDPAVDRRPARATGARGYRGASRAGLHARGAATRIRLQHGQ